LSYTLLAKIENINTTAAVQLALITKAASARFGDQEGATTTKQTVSTPCDCNLESLPRAAFPLNKYRDQIKLDGKEVKCVLHKARTEYRRSKKKKVLEFFYVEELSLLRGGGWFMYGCVWTVEVGDVRDPL
jgi:hypothetical protein